MKNPAVCSLNTECRMCYRDLTKLYGTECKAGFKAHRRLTWRHPYLNVFWDQGLGNTTYTSYIAAGKCANSKLKGYKLYNLLELTYLLAVFQRTY